MHQGVVNCYVRTAHKMAQNCIAFCVQIPYILAKFNSFCNIPCRRWIWQTCAWEARSFSSIQNFPCIVCNRKFHYHLHKSPQHVLFLSQINPTHTFGSWPIKTSFNVVILYMPTARAELRGRPAGQLSWSPTYSGLQDVTGIIGNNGTSQ